MFHVLQTDGYTWLDLENIHSTGAHFSVVEGNTVRVHGIRYGPLAEHRALWTSPLPINCVFQCTSPYVYRLSLLVRGLTLGVRI